MENQLVFVYGTLRKGQGNARLLANALYRGDNVSKPNYTMVSLGGFPGVIKEGTTTIMGEVYEVTQDILERLDRLEGYPKFYNRILVPTEYGLAWMYTLDESYLSSYPVIDSGDWLKPNDMQ